MSTHAINTTPLTQEPVTHYLRENEAIHSVHLDEWQGYRPRGMYFVKNTLKNNLPANQGRPVILMPGGFDPLAGAYSDKLIHSMLSVPGVGSVWEVHYRHDGKCGYGYAPVVIHDIEHICIHSTTPPLLVGMSGGSLLLAGGLLLAAQHKATPSIKAALILGMYLIGYENLFARLLLPYYRRPSMQEKIVRHCGHPHVYATDLSAREWWETNPEYRRIVDNPKTKIWDKFPLPVEMLYFRIDTLSRRGAKRMQQLFDCTTHSKPIPGHHRSLRKGVLEADTAIVDFCRRYA